MILRNLNKRTEESILNLKRSIYQKPQELTLHLMVKNLRPTLYCCMGNLMDREAWWATSQGVAKE